jgi:hypothetical protein
MKLEHHSASGIETDPVCGMSVDPKKSTRVHQIGEPTRLLRKCTLSKRFQKRPFSGLSLKSFMYSKFNQVLGKTGSEVRSIMKVLKLKAR